MKYNPGFWDETTLQREFVVRRDQLAHIVAALTRRESNNPRRHVLLVGQRGMGKTMLARAAAHRIRNESAATHLVAALPEEIFEVTTLGELWLELLFHIGHGNQEHWASEAYARLRYHPDFDSAGSAAFEALMTGASHGGRQLVIIIENVDAFLDTQLAERDRSLLLNILETDHRISTLATSCSSPDDIAGFTQRLIRTFDVVELPRLGAAECQALVSAITSRQLTSRQVRPLEIVTGGNPRLLRILASFDRNKSFRQLMSDLTYLIDEHTSYFKHNLEALPLYERKVFVALANIWRPATLTELARTARIDIRRASVFTSRLLSRGLITRSTEGRGKRYEIAERLYNIYYLMRRSGRSADRVRAIVDFMLGFYQPDEAIASVSREACTATVDERDTYFAVAQHILRYVTPAQRPSVIRAIDPRFLRLSGVPSSLAEMLRISNAKRGTKSIHHVRSRDESDLLQQAMSASASDPLFEQTLRTRINREPKNVTARLAFAIFLHLKQEHPAEALEQYDIISGLLGSDHTSLLDTLKAMAYVELGRMEEAAAASQRATHDTSADAQSWYVAAVVRERLGDFHNAERALVHALELEPSRPDLWHRLADLRAFRLDNYVDAERAVRRSIELKSDDAVTWCDLGHIQCHSQSPNVAIRTIRHAINLDPAYIRAYRLLASIYREDLGDKGGAIGVLRDCAHRNPNLAIAWAELGRALAEIDLGEAEGALRHAIELDSKSADAWHNLGHVLIDSCRNTEAEEAFRTATQLQSKDSGAWYHIGKIREAAGDYGGAEEAYLEAVRTNPASVARAGLIALAIRRDAEDLASALTARILSEESSAAHLFSVSRALARYSDSKVQEIALRFARQAFVNDPKNATYALLLSNLLVSARDPASALAVLPVVLGNPETVSAKKAEVIDLLIRLAASESTSRLADLVDAAEESSEQLEPFVVALRSLRGLDIRAPEEIRLIADDVVTRIQTLRTAATSSARSVEIERKE